jgi:hypothetical protein
MASEKNDTSATVTGCVDVFQPFALNHVLQSLWVGGREVTEDSEQPAKAFKTTVQQKPVPALIQFRKCEL